MTSTAACTTILCCVRASAVAVALIAAPALAQTPSHGLSTFGELKYKPGFTHFDYVNPNAPKGGRLSTIGTSALTTFDSFNPFIIKGDPAQGLGLLYDRLMTGAADEPDAMYGLVAHTVEIAADAMRSRHDVNGAMLRKRRLSIAK